MKEAIKTDSSRLPPQAIAVALRIRRIGDVVSHFGQFMPIYLVLARTAVDFVKLS
jgi:hypothetical protein